MSIVYSVLVLGALGAIFGALLAFAAKIFHVEVDPKQAAVRECLAGANCGGCGFSSCDAAAEAIEKGENLDDFEKFGLTRRTWPWQRNHGEEK